MKINVYFAGFWNGFLEGTDPVNFNFFIQLFKEVYNTNDINLSSYEDSNILVESVFLQESNKHKKKWTHTYLFSGESYIKDDLNEYDCVLYCKETKNNIVNLPLFIPYIYCNFGKEFILKNETLNIEKIPDKDVVVFIGNPNGQIRNTFLEKLEKKVNVTYAGSYKNNLGYILKDAYNTKVFFDFVSNFKFIITMENSEEETYITEKITHGFFSRNIPVYWGSPKIYEYINSDRILALKNTNEIDNVIEQIQNMNDEEWLKKVNSKPFTDYCSEFVWNKIILDIKKCLKIIV